MGFRFRKSVRLIPGVRLNFSRSGPSVTVGGRGLSTNYSKRGSRSTVSLPGTGLSYTTSHTSLPPGSTSPIGSIAKIILWLIIVIALLVIIF
jgi:hypothetical protein